VIYIVCGRLLLLKGNALCSTNAASLAMSPLLEALTLAKRSHCVLLTSLATVHLALVQVRHALSCLAVLVKGDIYIRSSELH